MFDVKTLVGLAVIAGIWLTLNIVVACHV